MGVEYWIVDKGKKTFYDLGKGPWGWGWDDISWTLADADLLKEALCDLWKEFKIEPMLPDDYDYVCWLAKDLHKHFGQSPEADVILIRDGGGDVFDIMSNGYRGIGSRYLHKSTHDKREKELKRLNRHFDAHRGITRHYDLNDMKTFPGFDEW